MAPKSASKQQGCKIAQDEQAKPYQHPADAQATVSLASPSNLKSQTYCEPLGPPAPLSSMKKAWEQPEDSLGGFFYQLRMYKFRFDFMTGCYLFDLGEAVFTVALFATFCVLLFYGAFKQVHHALDLLIPLVSQR